MTAAEGRPVSSARTTGWTARALATLDDSVDDLVDMLRALVRIPSVSGSAAENEIQHHMAAELDALGLDIDLWPIPLPELQSHEAFPGGEMPRTEAWGLVGKLAGTDGSSRLMFNAHLDVVPPGDRHTWLDGDPYSARIDAGTLYGRGACDMKAGALAALFAVQALRRSGVRLCGDVLFATVQGEEDGGMGTFAMLQRGWRADACVIPEPTGLDLVPATAGSLTFRLRVPGHATHAARRTAGTSALEMFWPIWTALTDLERRRNVDADPLLERWDIPYPLSIGAVRCGEWASSVPDLLIAEGRIGVALDEPASATQRDLEAAVAAACRTVPWLREHPAQVEWWGGRFESGRLSADSDLLARVGAAHRAVGGRPQAVWGAPYGSDLRLMTGIGGVPTLHYGPGDVALAHGPNESVPVADVITCARALVVLALDYCGVDG